VTLRVVNVDRIGWVTILMVAVAALGGEAVGAVNAVSVAAGGAFMLADFHLIRMLVSLLIRPGSGPWGRASALLLLTLKFLLAVILLAGVLYQFPIAPMSFALGASMLLVACLLDAIWLGEPVGPLDDARATTE